MADAPSPAEPVAEPTGGLRCPRCNSAVSHVRNTRRLSTGRVRRYRQCHHCGRRFITLEVPAQEK